ncbi:MAG: hypothetical protein IPJ65_41840 [Archangiaceae bacterium]|nr:hypothetical protein [Archangiaceae bacterium]
MRTGVASLLVAVVVVGASGCGGSNTTSTCTGAVMGALTGTFSVCNDFDERYRANLDTWSFTAAYTELPTSFTWSTEWEPKGEPKATTYLFSGDPNRDTKNLSCDVTLEKAGKKWVARNGAGTVSSGDCSMTVSSVETLEENGNVTTYKVQGDVTAHLEAVPGTGSTGAITFTLAWCKGDVVMCPQPMR